MTGKFRAIILFALLTYLSFISEAFCKTEEPKAACKYPDYSYEYAGRDRCENFNRKMFTFNCALNRYALRPVHTVWASVLPQYGMDRINSATANIEYPIRLVSCMIQKDFKASGRETVRFLTNTTVGLGGLYDPAKKFLKIEPVAEDMEQALAKCKVKSGPYLVIPVLNATTPRNIAGKILDAGLNPSSYIASPVLAMVKAGILVNRTSYMQPISKMIESNYADPYDITKKLYSLEKHIKVSNLDRKEVLNSISMSDPNIVEVKHTVIEGSAQTDALIRKDKPQEPELKADLYLPDYNPQHPVTDSMRTALFELPGINDSIWNELSVWNRSFSKRIRTSSVNVYDGREDYCFRYIMQKDKNSPIAVIYPSIGEGIMSHHSIVMAKLFYDAGYSVVIQGSHFQWEFLKSMPEDYKPGLPAQDAKQLAFVTGKILDKLEKKYDCTFKDRVLLGTSFGAMTALFIASHEAEENTLNVSKYISINPPVELMFAMKQMDDNSEEWQKNADNFKDKAAVTAAKVIQTTQLKDSPDFKIGALPFSSDEAKLITGFVMHQKLSDLVFTIEKASKNKKCELYEKINNMSYRDYAQKYLVTDEKNSLESLWYETSLYSISNYLKNNTNYKIYHALDDYLVNTQQLKKLKRTTGKNTVLVSNGGHLGFLYRQEFIDSLKKDISQTPES
ncbi:MAG: VacJ family lipoprotein [Clostridium sp.]|nr:VacJ family lipoprotein [Clostridium sp.]